MIDWTTVQRRLDVRVDGIAGPVTYAALIGVVGARMAGVAATLARSAVGYGMTTPARLAEFIAQIANETGGFRRWEENLNYSAAGLRRTWPARFPTLAGAEKIAGRPQLIAEDVYGGRMGNTAPGDGWRYRGRGALQLTGKANYRLFGDRLDIDLMSDPDRAADPATSVLIALEFFRQGRVNDAVDRGDFREARRITNGAAIGLEHVAALRAKLLAVLA